MIFFNPNLKNADKQSKKYKPYVSLVNTLNTNDLGLMDSLLNLQSNELLVINILSNVNDVKSIKKENFFNKSQYEIAQKFINSKTVKYVGNKDNYSLSFSGEDMQKIMQQDFNNIPPRLLSNIDVLQNIFVDVTGNSKQHGFIVLEIYVKNNKKNNKKTYYILPLGEDIVNEFHGLINQYMQMGLANSMMNNGSNNKDQVLSDEVKDFLPKDNNKNSKLKKLSKASVK